MIPNALWPAVHAVLVIVAAWTLVAVVFVILLIIPLMLLGAVAMALLGIGRRIRSMPFPRRGALTSNRRLS